MSAAPIERRDEASYLCLVMTDIDTIVPDEFGELKLLAWNRDPTRAIPAGEAFALYEREWRHVDLMRMSDDERRLIVALTARFGKGTMLV